MREKCHPSPCGVALPPGAVKVAPCQSFCQPNGFAVDLRQLLPQPGGFEGADPIALLREPENCRPQSVGYFAAERGHGGVRTVLETG